MDFKTFGIAIVLGALGTIVIGGLLNIPDAGAIIAIAFVGGRIAGLRKGKSDK